MSPLSSRTLAVALSLALSLAAAADLPADEIVLLNGNTLSGTVTKADRHTLVLATDFSSPIKIKIDKIAALRTDGPVTLRLENGEIVRARLDSATGGRLTASVEGGTDRMLGWDEIDAVNPRLRVWEGSVAFGSGQQSGNTETFNATVDAVATARWDRHRLKLRLLHNYGEEDDAVTTRNTFASGKYDYFFRPRIYGYLNLELSNDKFKDLDLGTIIGPGLGYQIWDESRRSLMVEGGLAYNIENRIEAADKEWLTGRLAAELSCQLLDNLRFTDAIVFYPSLDYFGEYQARNEASLSSRINGNWSLKLSNIVERDSDPPEGVGQDDITWSLGLQYDFD